MNKPKIVSREEWLISRRELLVKEKELTRQRDAISSQRRKMPWVLVDKQYDFTGSKGKQSLSDLFGDKRQLLIYHFMLGPGWEEGCVSCSFWADNFNGIDIHLAHRDIQFLVVSRAELPEIKAYQERMGWDI